MFFLLTSTQFILSSSLLPPSLSPNQHILFSSVRCDNFPSTPLLLLLPPQTMESQMEEWYREVGQLQVQVASIPQQTQVQVKETVAGRQAAVEARMVRLIEPLKERRRILLASKEVHQVGRDLEDEIVSLGVVCQHTHTHTRKLVSVT